MWVRTVGSLSIGTVALLAVVSGCGSGSSGVPSAANLSAPVSFAGAQPDNNGHGKGGGSQCKGKLTNAGGGGSKGGGSVIYTANLYGHDLNVYSTGTSNGLNFKCFENQGVVDPEGTVTTVNGWWYVTNGAGMNVLVYRTKHGLPQGPLSSLSDYNEIPVNVDVNPSRNLVAVSNYTPTSSGNGSMSVYLHRQSVPTRTLTYGAGYGSGVAIDHKGNCYWALDSGANYTGTGKIVEFAKCSGSGTVVISESFPIGGLAFDQSGDLYFIDSNAGSQGGGVYMCTKTSSCIPLSPGSQYSYVQPLNMNFDYHGKHLWVADIAGYVDEVEPSGTIEHQYAVGSSNPPFGIAPEPGS